MRGNYPSMANFFGAIGELSSQISRARSISCDPAMIGAARTRTKAPLFGGRRRTDAAVAPLSSVRNARERVAERPLEHLFRAGQSLVCDQIDSWSNSQSNSRSLWHQQTSGQFLWQILPFGDRSPKKVDRNQKLKSFREKKSANFWL